MALIFQYGSNMSTARLNHEKRMNGDAKVIEVVRTKNKFIFGFTVFSKTNKCAAADIELDTNGEIIYGVLYEIPDYLLTRDLAGKLNRKSMDGIEGLNYKRHLIDVIKSDGEEISVWTYTVKDKVYKLKTSKDYISHIITGLREHHISPEYYNYIKSRIVENDSTLESFVQNA